MENRRLIIKNVGPISSIEIELNKVNVFIGEQGSGKSTIAKLISYCTWVEKKIALDYGTEYFETENTFIDSLTTFHKLDGYFNENSFFRFESEILEFEYYHNIGKPEIKIKDLNLYKRKKISYIPSERNIVASIPNWFEVKLPDNNIRSFMSDWENARKTHTKENPLEVLNFGFNYHYDESIKGDIITYNNGEQFALTNVASGFQAIVPLLVVVEYVTKWIYRNEENDSVVNLSKHKKISSKVVSKDLEMKNILEEMRLVSLPKDESRAKEMVSFITNRLDELDNFVTANFIKTNSTHLIIEEPEQNLFPQTQRDLLYSLIGNVVNNEKDICLTLTTHSPYILYAINNCLMGGLVKDIVNEKDKEIASSNSWIDTKLVSIWQITKENTIISLKNERDTLGKHFFNDVLNDVMDEYYILIKYLNKVSYAKRD
ncbi:MAG: hypothetical protein H6Q15_2018 [Bacteroidetes bacterium]|nr:hypothetical protein [Bacteroidota bacterium]